MLAELFQSKLPGITTWANPYHSVMLQDNLTLQTVQIGQYERIGDSGKMLLCSDGFDSLGIPAICRCLESSCEWVSIDEIGFLESGLTEYQAAVRKLFDQKHVAAVLRKQSLPFLDELRSRQDVFLVDLDEPYGSIGCVIMASGLGKRFGSNKIMADFDGRPMLQQILDATDGIFAKRIVVTRHTEVADYCKQHGVSFLLHELPFRSDTVRLGLQQMTDTMGCIFCASDQPLLQRETLAALALSFQNGSSYIWRFAYDGIPAAPVLFPQWCYSQLLDLPEGKGGAYVAKQYPDDVYLFPVFDPYTLTDADTPETLEKLLSVYLQRKGAENDP